MKETKKLFKDEAFKGFIEGLQNPLTKDELSRIKGGAPPSCWLGICTTCTLCSTDCVISACVGNTWDEGY